MSVCTHVYLHVFCVCESLCVYLHAQMCCRPWHCISAICGSLAWGPLGAAKVLYVGSASRQDSRVFPDAGPSAPPFSICPGPSSSPQSVLASLSPPAEAVLFLQELLMTSGQPVKSLTVHCGPAWLIQEAQPCTYTNIQVVGRPSLTPTLPSGWLGVP